jgi:hypothetical protein
MSEIKTRKIVNKKSVLCISEYGPILGFVLLREEIRRRGKQNVSI